MNYYTKYITPGIRAGRGESVMCLFRKKKKMKETSLCEKCGYPKQEGYIYCPKCGYVYGESGQILGFNVTDNTDQTLYGSRVTDFDKNNNV